MSILRLKTMGLKGGSRSGIQSFTVKHEVVCSASPAVDTLFNVAAYMRAQGYFDGAPLTVYPNAVCVDVDIDTDRASQKVGANGGTGLWYWPIVSTFTTQPRQDPAGNKQDDPKLRPTKFTIRQARYGAPAVRDTNFDPVENSASDPIRREEPRARLQITIDKTVATFDPTLCLDARRKTIGSTPPGFLFSRNLNTWNPFGPYAALFGGYTIPGGKGLLHDLTFGLNFENNQFAVDIHAEILVDDDFHRDRCWDEGYRVLEVSEEALYGYVKVPYQDPHTGSYASSPVPLDGNGMALDAGQPMHELKFQYFPQKDWSALPIP